ncbi:MAG: insulinase family protein [Prevotella sp.]|nr:insulinase family protein [Prevotella sp.]MCM1074511.1 insulinase family protein [Ruminococcus sp.]
MQLSKPEIYQLSNGLRIVTAQRPGVTFCGLAIGVGTRDESAVFGNISLANKPAHDESGLAHFVEHTIFKGTTNRRSHNISSRMESVGGELNAYTTKEETLIYTIAPSGFTERAIDLLADLCLHCNFPAEELEREKEVVIDEINSYLDNPAESIFDEFEDLMYADSPLGHNILGTRQSVKGLTSADCRNFVDKYYTAENIVLYCVGTDPAKKVIHWAEKYFSEINREKVQSANRKHTPEIYKPFDKTLIKDLHQSHTLMGARVFDRHDPRRYALLLLNNYLGGPAMNSVLNRELREKRGYVYTVESMLALLSDCGMFMVYFGCDAEHIKACKRIVRNKLEALAETPMKSRVFDAARRQYLGQLEVAASYAENSAMNLGKSVLYYGKVLDAEYTRRELLNLAPEHIQEVAALICERGLSALTMK